MFLLGLPDSCKAFKKQLVVDNDYVGDFVREVVKIGFSKDFVKVRAVFDDFKRVHAGRQRDSKTKMKFDAFLKVMQRCFPEGEFKKTYPVKGEQPVLGLSCAI